MGAAAGSKGAAEWTLGLGPWGCWKAHEFALLGTEGSLACLHDKSIVMPVMPRNPSDAWEPLPLTAKPYRILPARSNIPHLATRRCIPSETLVRPSAYPRRCEYTK